MADDPHRTNGTLEDLAPTGGLDPRVRIGRRPQLQRPGAHRAVGPAMLYPDPDGPAAHTDRRMYIDVETARLIYDAARASLATRVGEHGNAVLHGVTLRVEMREAPDGHRYAVWKIGATDVVPESTLLDVIREGM